MTQVQYPGPAAWRHDDEDGLVPIGQKTWAQWRGYNDVIVLKGSNPATQTKTESRYFRGMDGDLKSDGTHKSVSITDSTGGQVPDQAPLAGQMREQQTFNGTAMLDQTITDQWVSAPTATRVRPWATTSAFQTQQAGNHQTESLDTGGTRQSAATNTYDGNGVLTARRMTSMTSSTIRTTTPVRATSTRVTPPWGSPRSRPDRQWLRFRVTRLRRKARLSVTPRPSTTTRPRLTPRPPRET
ncbi:hypothetical protein [Fodinicola feengrottensis]|uniref:hypothetical protein n=1 Tax=Fodinicola feengrottensis TaxID=435914 RepID=UPI0013D68BFD|nr:hypothetical protein [Fodinicola feengrottensis]